MNDTGPERGERILICLSPSPSNKKVIAAACKMAAAFHAALTAVYVKTDRDERLSDEERHRLQGNMEFARQNGASVTTIVGSDVPAQIVEFAHVSGSTKIVVGRSGTAGKHFWDKAGLTEQLVMNAPDVDIYIIPDSSADYRHQTKADFLTARIRPTLRDTVITILLLAAASCVGLTFTLFGFSKANIITVFILGVLIISVTTVSPLYSAVSSLLSVLLFNWFFIEPKFSFHTYETEYVVTFGIMLISSLITGTLANKLKENARNSALEAFRAKVLFDTNQLLQKADTSEEVIRVTARQVTTLLDRDVAVYPVDDSGKPGKGFLFKSEDTGSEPEEKNPEEAAIVQWVFDNRQAAGSGMEYYGRSDALYHPISIYGYCYGVIAIRLQGKSLETFEYSVFSSILGECALALESLRNAAEREEASVMAKNEQLRANLLRSISHDIRTPLTSISGNASNLLAHYEVLDKETLKQIFSDIYDDSEWLIDLVENLLSISRIENGQMELNLSMDMMNDVIEEAIKHIDRDARFHKIVVRESDDLLLVRMDTRLIMQVLINLVNNAIHNTQEGSEIIISSEKKDDRVYVSVSDDGKGIPDEIKAHVFEMFYTGTTEIADGRRGLGLGLALCKSIIEAHGGTITLSDNNPSGCRFTFSLPVEKVTVNE
ncbi:MAG: sensor histidine kinase KdpD [Eubacterium sp.]|nr:sensor histidine kinase KdpD [Eubacterium sp.]